MSDIHILFLTLALHYLLISNSKAMNRRIITTLNYSKYHEYHMKPVIVHGKHAAQGDVNFMVSFKIRSNRKEVDRVTKWEVLCGGSIIGDYTVLTAAHCFEDDGFYYKNHPEAVRIVAGNFLNVLMHDGSTETNITHQWRKISNIKLHHKFRYPLHDIALVTANERFVFNDDVARIRVAKITSDYPFNCKAAGFGLTSNVKPSRPAAVLMVANIEPMTMQECTDLWGMDMDTFICTHSVLTDVAPGDSGGPMSCEGTRDAYSAYEPILVGVVSGKNFDRTTLFTRVSRYNNWIRRGFGSQLKSNILLVAIIQLVFIYVLFILIS